jgi:hypothetical protein
MQKMVKNKELFINKIFTPMKSSHPKSLVSIGLHSTITARTPNGLMNGLMIGEQFIDLKSLW